MTCLESQWLELADALSEAMQLIQLEGSSLQAGLQVIHKDSSNVAHSAVHSFAQFLYAAFTYMARPCLSATRS